MASLRRSIRAPLGRASPASPTNSSAPLPSVSKSRQATGRFQGSLPAKAKADTAMVRTERYQRQMAGALDGHGQGPLMLGAHAGLAPRLHLVSVCDISSEPVHVFVVDVLHMVYTEGADLSTSIIPRPAASSSSSSSARPAAARSAAGRTTAAGPSAGATRAARSGSRSRAFGSGAGWGLTRHCIHLITDYVRRDLVGCPSAVSAGIIAAIGVRVGCRACRSVKFRNCYQGRSSASSAGGPSGGEPP